MATVNYAKLGPDVKNIAHQHEYANYREFKGWSTFFNPSDAEIQLLDYEFRNVPIGPGVSLLDIGFGNGALLKWASNKLAHIAGIELNEDLINEAKKLDVKLFTSLNCVESKSINVLTFMDVFEHLEINEINQTFVEARRVLRDDGYLVARFPNCQSPSGLAEQFGDHTHKTMLSAPIFSSKAIEHGFKIISIAGAVSTSEFPSGFKGRLLAGIKGRLRKIIQLIYRLGFGTGKTLLSPSVIIIAKLA